MLNKIRHTDSEAGQTIVEYVLVLLFIVLMLIAAFQAADIGSAVNTAGGRVQNTLTDTD